MSPFHCCCKTEDGTSSSVLRYQGFQSTAALGVHGNHGKLESHLTGISVNDGSKPLAMQDATSEGNAKAPSGCREPSWSRHHVFPVMLHVCHRTGWLPLTLYTNIATVSKADWRVKESLFYEQGVNILNV